jgi:arginyl-tRNA synthetase
MTQDIGTAIQRVNDFPDVGGMVYTVGNEQDYHFKVLFLILKNSVSIGLRTCSICLMAWSICLRGK